VRDWALFIGTPELWQVFGRLRESVITGEAAFPREHGMVLWEYMAEHPHVGAAFDRWMGRQSDQHNAAIVSAYDFSTFRTVADIGGGQGSTLATIMQVHPGLKGVLLDLPHVVEHADVLQSAVAAGRCEVIGGDMLQYVPVGADAYVIKRVLMDWGDEPAEKILRQCAEAMTEGGKVLVVEMVLPPASEPSTARIFDMIMLLNQPGGRLRTEAEFRSLFANAGLELARVIPTASPNSIIEGVRA
jgi:hypothetical protein